MSNSRYDPREGRDDMDDSPVQEQYEDDGALDLEKSTKHRSKDKKRSSGLKDDKEHRSGKEWEEKEGKDSERDRASIRDRKRDDRDDRDKEKSKDGKARDRDYDREKYRDKERKDRGKERDREEKDSDRARDKEKGKEKSRDRDRDRHKVKEKEKENEREKHKDHEKEKESYRDGEKEKGKEKIRERGREIDQGKERSRASHHTGDGTNYEGSMQQPSTAEVEERVLKMKEARMNKQPEGASEILSWVSKSRKLEERKNVEKEKAKQLSKLFEEQDNVALEESDDDSPQTADNLAGVKVLHGLDRVVEGGAVVLTLKDQNILADGDINQEIDMLENVEIGEQKRRNDAYKAAKKKTGIYVDKFNDDPLSEKKMLPQYDEPTPEEGFILDERGRISGEAEKKLEELRRRLQGVPSRSQFEDLNSSGKTTSDYYTQEEMLQFKKPKKKKSLRKKEKLDIDALEAEARSSGLGAGDLGTRNEKTRQAIKEEKEKSEAEMRKNAYQTAYAKADEASKLLRLGQTIAVKTEEDKTPIFAADDDDDLFKSLERARRLALRKQEKDAASGPQAVALLAASNPSSQIAEEQTPVAGEVQESKVVFTEMEEFVWGLQIDEEAHKPKGEDVFMQDDEDGNTLDEEQKEDGGGWSEVKESEDGEPVDKNEEVIVPDGTIHESTLGKGLSGALKLLQGRGTLKETIEWGGRNMDKKKSKLVGILEDGEQKEIKKEIRIERTDEFGRILTPKEAFRLLSHKFHGKGPGKMKLEKRQKQFQEELKMKQMKSTDTPSLSVERMRETQARLKTPYLVLSGHVKPGQTSDPKSGFATVEKDFSGGLTPMLGDQKVEHFLGIKRKAEPSNLGAPKRHKP